MASSLKADKSTWIGRGLTLLIALAFLMSAIMKLRLNAEAKQQIAALGLPEPLIPILALIEGLCVLFYLIPQTTVLGAILFTGYLGGAICTHLRVGEPVYIQSLLGVLVWLGVYLREPRLRQILPLRGSAGSI